MALGPVPTIQSGPAQTNDLLDLPDVARRHRGCKAGHDHRFDSIALTLWTGNSAMAWRGVEVWPVWDNPTPAAAVGRADACWPVSQALTSEHLVWADSFFAMQHKVLTAHLLDSDCMMVCHMTKLQRRP